MICMLVFHSGCASLSVLVVFWLLSCNWNFKLWQKRKEKKKCMLIFASMTRILWSKDVFLSIIGSKQMVLSIFIHQHIHVCIVHVFVPKEIFNVDGYVGSMDHFSRILLLNLHLMCLVRRWLHLNGLVGIVVLLITSAPL